MQSLFTTPEMTALFADRAHVQRLLDVEAALARAEARIGVIPAAAAEAIALACSDGAAEIDLGGLYRDAATAGTLAIPLVRWLTARVPADARGYVHWGATSQDIIDTTLALQLRDALRLLDGDLLAAGAACAALADRHRATPMAGRTLLQQALPITFGLKAARWLGLITRAIARLRDLRPRVLVVQLGGAAGTLASLGSDGPAVVEALAAELGLGAPDLPWHAERDRLADAASALGITAGAMAKIANDIVLLMQTEVGEVAEGAAPGKGGSSTLPHKRNPVDAMLAGAAARLAIAAVPVFLNALAGEHERAVGGWQAEWSALPDLCRHTAGAVAHTRAALTDLDVYPERMRANLDLTAGQLMTESLATALAPHLGRDRAQSIAGAISRQAAASGASVREVARADPAVLGVLSPSEINRALDPVGYTGSADVFIDRALAGFRKLGTE